MIRLINNWQGAWKALSVQISAAGAAAVAAWGALPQEFKDQIPADYIRGAAFVSFILIMAGRVIAQPKAFPTTEVSNDSGTAEKDPAAL